MTMIRMARKMRSRRQSNVRVVLANPVAVGAVSVVQTAASAMSTKVASGCSPWLFFDTVDALNAYALLLDGYFKLGDITFVTRQAANKGVPPADDERAEIRKIKKKKDS